MNTYSPFLDNPCPHFRSSICSCILCNKHYQCLSKWKFSLIHGNQHSQHRNLETNESWQKIQKREKSNIIGYDEIDEWWWRKLNNIKVNNNNAWEKRN